MIATARQLAIATAIVVALAIVLAVDAAREREVADRAIVSGFAADAVTALVWPDRIAFEPASGPPVRDLRIIRDPASSTGWAWRAPAGEAEPGTVEDVLAALRGARWHRAAAPTAAGDRTATLVVERPGGSFEIAIGERFGEDQQWIVVGERALLVDAWVVRALVPEPIALRVRAPLARAAEATVIGVTPEVSLRGTPRRIERLGDRPIQLLATPSLVDNLERALAELVVIALPSRPLVADDHRTISLDGELVVASATRPCPNVSESWAIVGARTGVGCVSEASWRALADATSRFYVPLEEPGRTKHLARLVERRPAPITPTRVTLADGGVLELARRPRVGDRDADPARVAELLAVLATPGEPVALPAVPPVGRVEVTARDTAIAIELYPGGLIARRGEPIALRIGEGAHAILARPARAYRDPEVWLEEPTTVVALTIDGVTYERGAVLGEWTGPGADAAKLERLVGLLARLESRGAAPGPAPRARTFELAIAPPSGARVTRRLAVGEGPAGCTATVNGEHLLVDPGLCEP